MNGPDGAEPGVVGGGPPPTGEAYDAIADAYDRFWGGLIDETVAELFEQLADEIGARGGCRVLDLCCGAGHLSALLADAGHAVTGVDISGGLLERARRRAPTATFVQGDIRDLDVGGAFDVAVCALDSLNHLADGAQLRRAFEGIAAALRPGGGLLFDVNVGPGFADRFEQDLGFADPDLACVVTGSYDPGTETGRYDIAVFRRAVPTDDPGSRAPWARTDASLTQHHHPLHVLEQALEGNGLEITAVLEAEALGLEDHTGRVFVMARRRRDRRAGLQE